MLQQTSHALFHMSEACLADPLVWLERVVVPARAKAVARAASAAHVATLRPLRRLLIFELIGRLPCTGAEEGIKALSAPLSD